jgi:hypothetical protein
MTPLLIIICDDVMTLSPYEFYTLRMAGQIFMKFGMDFAIGGYSKLVVFTLDIINVTDAQTCRVWEDDG